MAGGEILSPYEWSLLSRLVVGHSWLLARQGAEMTVFLHLISRTFPYYKFEERFCPRFLLMGRLQFPTFPCGRDASRLYRARCSLHESSVIFFERTGRLTTDPFNSIVNAPGIVDGFLELASSMVGYDDGAPTLFGVLGGVRKKLGAYWEEKKWPMLEVSMVDEEKKRIEESVGEGRVKAQDARDRRKRKQASAPQKEIKPGWVTQYMKEYCDDLDVPYAENLSTKKERAQAKGSARNFLAYCAADEFDPRGLLYEVCKHWGRFRGELKREDGTSVLLPASVSFTKFFVHRQAIVDWLRENKDREPKYDIRFTFIKDHREAEGD